MLKRGFKTWCETTALNFKKELGIGKQDPLSARALAQHLGIKLLTPVDISGISNENREVLLGPEASSWSAVTLCKGDRSMVIFNPCNAQGRQSNDIMHELAHIIIGHKPQIMHSFEAGIFMRHYDKSQEEEADCLAAILLLSRDALIRIGFGQMEVMAAAREYGVSEKLLNMRLQMSGVKAILARSSAKVGR